MGKVNSFTIEGLKLFFPSNDHSPPHFHAKRDGEWELRVKFLEGTTDKIFEVKWSKVRSIPRDYTRLLETMISAHREALLLEWEQTR